MEKGSSLEEGIARFTQEAQSPLLTRVGGVLLHVSREGVSPSSMNALQRITEDVRMQERIRIRAFGQRLTVLTLLFIAGSALIPAFFLSFISIGSTFMESTWTPEEVLVITLVLFPLIDGILLAWVWVQSPIALPTEKKSPKRGIKSWVKRWDALARANGIKGGWPALARTSVIEGASLFIIAWCAYLVTHARGIEPILLLIGVIFFPLLVNLAWQEKVFRENTKRMERQSLDSLLYWSALPSSWSFEKRLEEIAKHAPTPIQEEWNRVLARLARGTSVEEALSVFGEGRASVLLTRVRQVLIQGYASGSALHDECARLAMEGMQQQALVEERETSLLIEKYTLLGAGGIVVPLILGLSTGMVEHFSQELGSGSLNPPLQLAAAWGTRGYLFAYSILASIFVGMIEGDAGKAKIYIITLLPLSQFIFWAASQYTAG